VNGYDECLPQNYESSGMTYMNRREFLDRSKGFGVGLAAGLTIFGRGKTALGLDGSGGIKAGVAARVVSPTKPSAIVGHRKVQLFSDVYTDLRIQTMALEDHVKKRVLWMGWDFCIVNKALVDRMKKLIHQQHGIEPEAICINSSHTHSAPPLTLREATRADHVDPRYTEFVVNQAVAVVGEALQRLAPARLRYAEDTCDTIAINRRLGKPGHVRMAPNPRGPVDHRVQIIAAESASDGSLIGVVVRHGCHPNTVTSAVGSGFPGFMRRFVEDKHPGAVAVFLQGCCGDVRNRSVDKDMTRFVSGTVEQAKGFGRDLAEAVERALKKPGIPITGPIEVNYSEIGLPMERVSAEKYEQAAARNDTFSGVWGKMYSRMIRRGEKIPETWPYRIQTFRFGRGEAPFTLVALDGEVFTEYAFKLEHLLQPGTSVVLGYSNGVAGYVPTAKAISEGGYEPARAYPFFHLPGPYTNEVESMILQTVVELLPRSTERPAK
jgi:hypothetical protein